MSDARPARRPVDLDALSGLTAVPAPAREQVLAEFVASRAGELAREARRVVLAHRVPPADRAAAHDAVTTAQQVLLRDIAAGHRGIDPRSWAPTVRAESARAVRRSAAQGTFAVAPYRQRLAAQRATLLAVRENAASGVLAPARPAVPTARPIVVDPAVVPEAVGRGGAVPVGATKAPVARTPAQPFGTSGPRHARQAATVLGQGAVPRRSLRWSTAALLSAVTIVVGAAVAPAEERPADGTGTSDVSFVDRLTMPISGLWDNLVGGGRVKGPEAVPVPVDSPTPTAPAVQQSPAPTTPEAPVAPVPPAVPPVPVAPGTGTERSPAPQGGDRHGNGSSWHDHDDMGRGEGHEREDDDDRDDDDDKDERRGDRHGRDEQRGKGRDDDRGDGHGSRDGSDRSRGRSRKVGERRHHREGAVPLV